MGFRLSVRPRYAPDSFKMIVHTTVYFPPVGIVARAMFDKRANNIGADGAVDLATLETIARAPDLLFARRAI